MEKGQIKGEDLLPERWIKTPLSYSKIGANLTLLQQDVLLRVSGELQSQIQMFYDNNRHLDPERPNSLFDTEILAMSLPPIEIKISDLGVRTDQYRDIKAAIDDLWKLEVRFHDPKERVLNDYHVFSHVQRPVTEKGYTHFGKDGEMAVSEKMTGKIKFFINPSMAKYVFDMSQGYINHLRYIARDSKKRSTPRVYLLLMRYNNFGQNKVTIPFTEVKEYLGMYEYDVSGEIVSEQYVEYARFKRNVLDVARLDLERLAANNQSDITFEYKPVYKGNKKRGNPDAIEFSINRSDLGKAREVVLHADSVKKKLLAYVVRHVPGVEKKRLKQILEKVEAPVIASFSKTVYFTVQKVSSGGVENAGEYLLSTLERSLKSETSIKNTAKKSTQSKSFDPIRQWALSQQQLCKAVSDDVSRRTFELMRYDGFDEKAKKIRVCCPREVYEEVEADHIDLMRKILTRNFGDGVQMSYRIDAAQENK